MDTMPERQTILVVDDTPDNLTLLAGLLKDRYRVRIANSGARALQIAGTAPVPDLVLLDVMMPEIDGHEVCRRLKANPLTADIPVIFLTARAEVADEEAGFAAGAVDYITKPVSPPIVLARVATHLSLQHARRLLADRNANLSTLVAERTRELEYMRDAIILAMASLAETRDNETGNHIRRTQRYVRVLAEVLADHPTHGPELSTENVSLLEKSAPLHDIGKVGVRDNVLLKPGRLTPDEFDHMKTHTVLGHEVLEAVERQMGSSSAFLRYTKEIARSHQEKWDGSGYPDGLAGTDIPLSARLMAVADVYDALISERVYKKAMPHDEAVAIIRAGRGQHFDPDVVDAFETVAEQFQEIAAAFRDSLAGS